MSPDQTPPNRIEAERRLIGAAMLYADRALMNALGLRYDEFFLPMHRDAWEVIRAQEKRNGAVLDPVTLEPEIKAAGAVHHFPGGWLAWATESCSLACLPEQVEHYATMVREAAAMRSLIHLCAELTSRAYNGETSWADLLESARLGVGELETAGAATNTTHVYQPMVELLDELDKRQQGIKPELVTTAIATLDEVVDGFEGGQLIIVAARPGQGKTALACNIAAANALRKVPCLVFSLEMRMRKIARRILIWHTKMPGALMNEADLDKWHKLQAGVADFEHATLWLNDKSRRLGQIVSEACRWHARYVRAKSLMRAAIMVDYAQLVRGTVAKGKNREQEVAEISQTFKGLAMHLDVPVVLLAQLNRACETRGGPPVLSDLRESGAIEQDADMVLFPYRDIPAGDQDKRNQRGPGQIIVAKNRDGRIGAAPIEWIPELMTFLAPTDPGAATPSDWQDRGDQ